MLVDNTDAHKPNYTRFVSFDPNLVMRRSNEWYDRLVAIAKLPPTPRKEAYNQLFADLETERLRVRDPLRLVAALFSQKTRSEMVSRVLVNLMLPALDVASFAEDRALTTFELTQLSAAIAVYRAKHKSYPATLEDLAPEIVEKLPADLCYEQPFTYKRTDDGYLVYCAGENGKDDGGSNEPQHILNGESFSNLEGSDLEEKQAQIPAGADDIAIRVPRLPAAVPKHIPPIE